MNPQQLPQMIANSMGQGVPAPQQVTQGSPNYDPSLGPQPTMPTPQGSPMSSLQKALQRRNMSAPPQQAMAASMQQGAAPQQGIKQPKRPKKESEIIIDALINRLKSLTQVEMPPQQQGMGA